MQHKSLNISYRAHEGRALVINAVMMSVGLGVIVDPMSLRYLNSYSHCSMQTSLCSLWSCRPRAFDHACASNREREPNHRGLRQHPTVRPCRHHSSWCATGATELGHTSDARQQQHHQHDCYAGVPQCRSLRGYAFDSSYQTQSKLGWCRKVIWRNSRSR